MHVNKGGLTTLRDLKNPSKIKARSIWWKILLQILRILMNEELKIYMVLLKNLKFTLHHFFYEKLNIWKLPISKKRFLYVFKDNYGVIHILKVNLSKSSIFKNYMEYKFLILHVYNGSKGKRF